jgi:hypothetical protein
MDFRFFPHSKLRHTGHSKAEKAWMDFWPMIENDAEWEKIFSASKLRALSKSKRKRLQRGFQ